MGPAVAEGPGVRTIFFAVIYDESNKKPSCVFYIGLSSELTHAGRPYELILLVSTLLVCLFLLSIDVFTTMGETYFYFKKT